MKHAKKLTKKERKALKELADQQPRPTYNHSKMKPMFRLSLFLEKQEEKKHNKEHHRQEKRDVKLGKKHVH